MSDTSESLEERVSRIEGELRELKARILDQEARPWWQQIVGEFEGDKAFQEIVRLGREIREADRKKAR